MSISKLAGTDNYVVSDKGVSVADVQTILGTSSSDVGTLCTHQNINMWSKHKPYSYPNAGATDVSLFGHGTYEQLAAKVNYGIDLHSITNNSGAWKSKDTYRELVGDSSNWSYKRPTGGANSPYRLGDFRLYYPDALPIILILNNTKESHNKTWSNDGTNDYFSLIAVPNDNGRSGPLWYSLAFSDFKDNIIQTGADAAKLKDSKLALAMFKGKFNPYTDTVTDSSLTPLYVFVNDASIANFGETIKIKLTDLGEYSNRETGHSPWTGLLCLAVGDGVPSDDSVDNKDEAPKYIIPFPHNEESYPVVTIDKFIMNNLRFSIVEFSWKLPGSSSYSSTATNILDTATISNDFGIGEIYLKIKLYNYSNGANTFYFDRMPNAIVTCGSNSSDSIEVEDANNVTSVTINAKSNGYVYIKFSDLIYENGKTTNILLKYSTDNNGVYYELGTIKIKWNEA